MKKYRKHKINAQRETLRRRLKRDVEKIDELAQEEEVQEDPRVKRLIFWVTVCVLTLAVVFGIYGFASGLFLDLDKMAVFIDNAGMAGSIVFLLVQIIQVIFPIIPGGVTCTAGVVLFGPYVGFALNYAGMIIGSICNFLLGRYYGKRLIRSFTKEKTYKKYIGMVENNNRKFEIFLWVTTILPGFPDDFICMLAGLTKIRFKRYVLIMLISKIVPNLTFSIGTSFTMNTLFKFLG